ncbi:alpha/beta hydrolase [Actinophytocola oryzae]|uniref:Alpha/beta hydrolase family protein n=1 Tax=Actinophytocola oryzae TaxID=502181 RepID=A0A4R7UWS2_9PSEU|nr:alpha/beta hydrolase [Actinophytocola oryzae]TDV40970.1 alpha/beta hydrolase family protein [Actinophytocola oryzae]
MATPLTMVTFDRDGRPVDDAPDRLAEAMADTRTPVTDVFLLSHGWLNTHTRALTAYEEWVRAMTDYFALRYFETEERRPGFRSLVVGVHWPSAPWQPASASRSVEAEIAAYADVLGEDTVEDLAPLVRRAREGADPERLTPADEDRFVRLDERAGLDLQQVGARPGNDRLDFEPGAIHADYRATRPGPWAALLAPLKVTSFWAMKRRALHIGATGVRTLLETLRQADVSGNVRFHLVGHSFGAIVCCAALQSAARPVHSLTLLQGALSLWSCAAVIPDTRVDGYFRPLVDLGLVTGSVVTTTSDKDRALRWFYRMAATTSRDYRLARPKRLPRYGAVGTYGLAGLDAGVARHLTVERGRLRYGVEGGRVYRADASAVVTGGGFSVQGGHSDLVHPELAGLVWEAAMVP